MQRLARSSQRGFTLLELLIALAVMGLLFIGIWQLIAYLNQNIQDQVVARQMRTIAIGTLRYSRVEGATFPTTWTAVPMATLITQRYLPSGMVGTNILGHTYTIVVRRVGTQAESFVLATGATVPYTDTRGARISGLIDAGGGYIYRDTPTTISGAFGGWNLPVGYFAGSGVTLRATDLVVSTRFLDAAAGAGGGDGEDEDEDQGPSDERYLHRRSEADNPPGANRMDTDIDMNINDLNQVGRINGQTARFADPGNASRFVEINMNSTVPSDPKIMRIMGNGPGFGQVASEVIIQGDVGIGQSVNIANGLYVHGGAHFTGGGDVVVSGGNLIVNGKTHDNKYNSDRRLKKDIVPVQNALEKLLKLQGVGFAWKEDGTHDLGVIAQDVEKVFPELVYDNPANKGMKAVRYHSLIAPVIEAIRELFDLHKKDIQDLKDENAALRRELDDLKKQVQGLSSGARP
ncbi:MAG: tail fiber domain-containing protein [Pseudomonadota bacterium]|nr:tail fiber domain-containing protein [Pseudomonadota bacterium]